MDPWALLRADALVILAVVISPWACANAQMVPTSKQAGLCEELVLVHDGYLCTEHVVREPGSSSDGDRSIPRLLD
jgi:hypothetical protein